MDNEKIIEKLKLLYNLINDLYEDITISKKFFHIKNGNTETWRNNSDKNFYLLIDSEFNAISNLFNNSTLNFICNNDKSNSIKKLYKELEIIYSSFIKFINMLNDRRNALNKIDCLMFFIEKYVEKTIKEKLFSLLSDLEFYLDEIIVQSNN